MIIAAYDNFQFIWDDVSSALSSTSRGTIIAEPGNVLYVGDFAQIESRTLAWLAGQQDKLDRFAAGEDLYCVQASGIFGRPITKADKDERQCGKVADLAYGYQGGIGSGARFADAYGLDLSKLQDAVMPTASGREREDAERDYLLYCKRTELLDQLPKNNAMALSIVKDRWRANHPKITDYWVTLEYAAIEAVKTGKPQLTGSVTFLTKKLKNGKLILYAKLPSGRPMAYPFPAVKRSERGKETLWYYGVDPKTKKWMMRSTYGGSLAENMTQAVSRDFMCDAMIRVEDAGYGITMTIHDEIVSETPLSFGSLEEFESLMSALEPWGQGLPMKVDVWKGVRYGKA